VSRRPVRDAAGNRYLLLKRSGESSLVRDPETGERQHLPNDEIELLAESAVPTVLDAVPDEVVTLVTAVHDERALAVLLELDAEGPMAVRTLLAEYDFCESDLHGLLGELRAAGLVAETTVVEERGYETTAAGERALTALRSRD
jgi:hypothetical protein